MNKIKNKTKLWKIILSSVISFSLLFSFAFCIHAEEPETIRSLIADLVNPVSYKTTTDGDVVFDSGTNREELNKNIMNNNQTTTVSLFDRFGPNISFVGYLGEKKIQTGIVDKIYTNFVNFGEDAEFSLTIEEIFDNSVFEVNNCVYKGRVDIQNSDVDPRYNAFKNAAATGSNTKTANFNLTISKILFDLENIFITGNLQNIYENTYDTLLSGKFMKAIQDFFEVFKYILMIAASIVILFMVVDYLKAKYEFKKIITKCLSFVLSFGLLYFFIYSPTKIVNLLKTINSGMNDLYTESLSDVASGNEIVDNSSNTLEASLWYICIFDPWCRGTFGDSYNNLYTYYSGKDESNIMPMSHDNILENWGDGSLRYSAKDICGDIVVPNGSSDGVRNWAALAYSTQSIYHLNATDSDEEINFYGKWPIAQTTSKNNRIYIDDLRLFDAMMNISCEYSDPTTSTGSMPTNGDNALRNYDSSNMIPNSFISLLRTLILLMPITIMSAMVILNFVKLSFYFILLIYGEIKNFFTKESFFANSKLKDVFNLFIAWIISIVMKILVIYLFGKLYDGLLQNLIYLMFCIVLVIEQPSPTGLSREVRSKFNNSVRYLNNKGINKLDEIKRRQKASKSKPI